MPADSKGKLIHEKLTVSRPDKGRILIGFHPQNPPHIFFDTNVVLGLNPEGVSVLTKLKTEYRFTYRYSILNVVELASHLGDLPNARNKNPFRKYQTALKKILEYFDPRPLPSPETVFMEAVGLYDYLGPKWKVNEEQWVNTMDIIAAAEDLHDLVEKGFNPEHYKKLRYFDGRSFLNFIEKAKGIGNFPPKSGQTKIIWGKYLGQFYDYLIYRASSRKKTFSSLETEEQTRVIKFFDGPGGKMFRTHFIKLLIKTLKDRRSEDANDFYDMLQLILLKDDNLLFVTDDRVFHQYYEGPELHRIVSWKLFKESASLP